MPPDLTITTDSFTSQVEALISGNGLLGPAGEDLGDAVESYRAAGRAALQRHDEGAWFQARITPRDWTHAEADFAVHIGPLLDRLPGQPGWWFVRKHPCWRIRVRTRDHAPVQLALDDLVTDGVITGWRAGIYEPETAAFGGLEGINAIHDLFCADSRGLLAYARYDNPTAGRRELSLILIQGMQRAAGLDFFEAGDVFGRVADMRPIPDEADIARIEALAHKMRPLLTASVSRDLFPEQEADAYATAWLAGFAAAGQRLGDAAAEGRLDRGLRTVLAQSVIFHWNRIDLSAPAQSVLAQAAKTALLPAGI